MPAERLVLDGEALGLGPDGRPRLFQDTVSWRAGHRVEDQEAGLRPFFFDLLHVDGVDLVDRPLVERQEHLHRVAGSWRVPAEVTDDPLVGEGVLAESLAAGHEGVVVKAAGSAYEAGRRGKAWRKVKPVHTLDLVVLAVEWGHGRRRGWLSNLHLGARAEDGDGFVMVGKTFKGMTDELLRWQTERFLAIAVDGPVGATDDPDDGPGVVRVRPEQVVEVAVDGVQRSTRYAGGVALRFARVVRYREDKDVADADTIGAVRALG
jgi:DNA ligase-1